MKRRVAGTGAWMPRDERVLELRALEQRLTDGYLRIEESIQRGVNVEEWEIFWCELLHQYEDLSDQLQYAMPTELAA